MTPRHPALELHQSMLERWRLAMDLVGPGPLEPHFEDAERSVAGLDARGDWADLGSGAGFPGIALAALHPLARVQLVERREKRAAFLEQVVAAARLANATVRCMDVADLPEGAYDGIISRAYRPPQEVIEDARRLLRPGGLVVLLLANATMPLCQDFVLFHVERYSVEGKRRFSVALRFEV